MQFSEEDLEIIKTALEFTVDSYDEYGCLHTAFNELDRMEELISEISSKPFYKDKFISQVLNFNSQSHLNVLECSPEIKKNQHGNNSLFVTITLERPKGGQVWSVDAVNALREHMRVAALESGWTLGTYMEIKSD